MLGLRSIVQTVILATLVLAGSVAADEGDCTWLPDLRCGRSGRYEGFVAPMSFPYLFEDPFITTGVSAWAIWHQFPDKSIFAGGDMSVLAVQARIALTDRLAFVASKDGWASHQPDLAILDNEKGYFDLIAGFKYALIDWPEEQFILTPSLRYQTSNGSRDVLAGNGEGGWIPALSAGWGLGDLHLIADVGAYLPIDGDEQSTPLFYNLHVDHPIAPRVVPFIALNGLHYIDDGDGSTLLKLKGGGRLSVAAAQAALGTGSFEAVDVLNIGSSGVDGNDVISFSLGARIPLTKRVMLGFGYDRPLTQRRDILKQRLSFNVLLEL